MKRKQSREDWRKAQFEKAISKLAEQLPPEIAQEAEESKEPKDHFPDHKAAFIEAVFREFGFSIPPESVNVVGIRFVYETPIEGSTREEKTIHQTRIIESVLPRVRYEAYIHDPNQVGNEDVAGYETVVKEHGSGLRKADLVEKLIAERSREFHEWESNHPHFRAAQMGFALTSKIKDYQPSGVFEQVPGKLSAEEYLTDSLNPPVRIKRAIAFAEAAGFYVVTQEVEQDYQIEEVKRTSVSDYEMSENMFGQD